MKAQIQGATLLVVFRWIPKDNPVFCTGRSGCKCSRCVVRGREDGKDVNTGTEADDQLRGVVGVARPPVSAAVLVSRHPDEPRMIGPNNINDRRVLSREAGRLGELTQASLATANDEPSLIPTDYWGKLLDHNDAYVPWSTREAPGPSPSSRASKSAEGYIDEGDQDSVSASIERNAVDTPSPGLDPNRPLSPWALLLLERRSGPDANPFLAGLEPRLWYGDYHDDGSNACAFDGDLDVNVVTLPSPHDVLASIFGLPASAVSTLGPRAVSSVVFGSKSDCQLGPPSPALPPASPAFSPELPDLEPPLPTAQTAPDHGFQNMAENAPPPGSASEPLDRAKEMAEYEKEKRKLKELLTHRGTLSQGLARVENQIADLESKYLESTPGGNILIGFDNYTKGVSGAAASRRKAGASEQNRVFSRSSISYNALNQDLLTSASAASTPAATPVTAAFATKDKDAMNAPTPGHTDKKASISKKRKEKPAALEDSETDTHNAKKVRTSFSAPRK